MNAPANLKYTKTHEWVAFSDDGTARIGLTDFAQQSMGSLVFVNLPEEEDLVEAGESCGDVESVKAVSDIVSPLSGTVRAVNEALLDGPGEINSAPYESWLIEVTEISGQEELMDSAAYEAFCSEEA